MFDDLKKLADSNELFSLERIIAPRLFRLFYLLGLAAIVILAMNHLFFSFRFGFGNGLWGLLEIAVIAPLALLGLRIVCEALILFFKNNGETIDLINQEERLTDAPNLIKEADIKDLGEAIDELANEQISAANATAKRKPASKRSNATTSARKTTGRKTTGRTALRKPPSKPKS